MKEKDQEEIRYDKYDKKDDKEKTDKTDKKKASDRRLPDGEDQEEKDVKYHKGSGKGAKQDSRDLPTSVLTKETIAAGNRDDNLKTRVSDPLKARRGAQEEKNGKTQEEDSDEEELPPKIVKDRHNSSIFAVAFTVLYLLFILISSIAISMFAIDVIKDLFALGKAGVEIEVTLEGDYITVKDLAEQLYDQHVIRHPGVFAFYAKLRHKDSQDFVASTRTVTTDMGYDALLTLFTPEKPVRKTISVTVPEGYTIDSIIDLFVSKGVGTRAGFEYVINEAPLDEFPFLNSSHLTYWFLDGAVGPDKGQIYRLEGYLYPDTYFVYDSFTDKEGDIPGTAAAKSVIAKMLTEFNKNVKKSYMRKHTEYIEKYYPNVEMSFTDIITLASILEKEGLPEERARISAVFYNRMNNPAYENIGGRLESNATVQYVLKHEGYPVSLEFGDFEKEYNTPYNSYLYAGLPPGPIVTPTRESINAALYPDYTCTAYYFVGTRSGYSFFADSLAEHQDNVARAAAGERAQPNIDEEELPEYLYGE